MSYGFSISVPQPGFASRSPDVVFTNDDIIEAAFKHFRGTGFPYKRLPLHTCLQEVNRLARTGNDELLRTTVGYAVADSYHPHRMHGRHHSARYSPRQLFDSDELLCKLLARTLKMEGVIDPDWIDGFRYLSACRPPHNFRPGFALYLYRRYCHQGAVVLDTSTGYGGRLVGWLASECGRYIGVDPSQLTHNGNAKMARDFGRDKDVTLVNLPVEDVPLGEFDGVCDFAFTSPPYFCTELYADEPTQSSERYRTIEEWCAGFLRPMLAFQYRSLKRGAYSLININDVTVRGAYHPLSKFTVECATAVGFEFRRIKSFVLPRFLGANGKNARPRKEDVIVLRKS